MNPASAAPARPQWIVLFALVLAAALTRLLPNPPNFSPIEATALFAGAWLASRWLAMAVPVAAMLVSDAVIGFHGGMPVVYGSMALIALAAHAGLRGRVTAARVALYGVGGALFFFVVTNLFVWLRSGMYPMSWEGLAACYVAAIPFFHNQLAGVAVYSTLLFGAWALIARRWPAAAGARAA
jgi:hypothetical protein